MKPSGKPPASASRNIARSRACCRNSTVEVNEPDTYAGIMIWESAEALAAFRETELSKTVTQAYAVDGAPEVEIGSIEIFLHDAVMVAA